MPRKLALAALVLLLLLPVARIASTWRVFSQTVDEPIHLAAGFGWLSRGTYDLDAEHPPLARLCFAVAPIVAGATIDPHRPGASKDLADERVMEGNDLLYRNGRYAANLAAVRAGNLPFFLLAAGVLFVWSRRLLGTRIALLALAFFGALPPILGHAALATTDMAATAAVLLALYLFTCWLDLPSWPRALALATAIAFGLLCKFSFAVYFPAGAAALAASRLTRLPRPALPARRAMLQALAGAGLAMLLVWAGYRFDLGTLSAAERVAFAAQETQTIAGRYAATPGYEWVRTDILRRYWDYGKLAGKHGIVGIDFVDWAKAAGYPSPLAGRHGDTLKGAPPLPPLSVASRLAEPFRAAGHRLATSQRIPAPMFVAGLEMVGTHSATGHRSFLLGRYSDHGWWYYFPVVLFFKTPIAFLILALAGMAVLWKRGGEARGIALAPLLMLLPAMASGINIGVRHVLPLYPLLAIAAAAGAAALWTTLPRKTLVTILLGWLALAGVRAHPDYLADFNELAGAHPEEIAVDSNLDWGQDLLRLEEVAREEKIEQLSLSYFGTAEWRRTSLPATDAPDGPVHGWLAVSEMQYKFKGPKLRGEDFAWLHGVQPVRRVGRSIRLYHLP